MITKYNYIFPLNKVFFSRDEKVRGVYQKLAKVDYNLMYGLVKHYDINTHFEIGVRAGYSGYVCLEANNNLTYVGIDLNKGTHGGRGDFIFYAEGLLRGSFPSASIEIIEGDTQNMSALPNKYDMIYVDGDHSYPGCLHDLEICGRSFNKIMLIDDYDYISSVRKAVDAYLSWGLYKYVYVKTTRGHVVIFKTEKEYNMFKSLMTIKG